MVTGVSYNVFNGEEHLLSSLRIMRKNVDYINIVVQYVSNFGLQCKPELPLIIEQALNEKLVDEVVTFVPDLAARPQLNEVRKRNIGLTNAKNAGITHFMTMDCDEYYVPEEFANAKEIILTDNILVSSCRSYLHIKRPIYRSENTDTTCISFLTKLESKSEIVINSYYPTLVDPTRRLHGDSSKFLFLDSNIVCMRHMNLVRHDLSWKLANSPNKTNVEFMTKVGDVCANWKFGEVLNFPNKPAMNIIQVEDIFDIDANFMISN